jgi:hypothetical protein
MLNAPKQAAALSRRKAPPEDFYLFWGVAGGAFEARRTQKFFAELFFKKATS